MKTTDPETWTNEEAIAYLNANGIPFRPIPQEGDENDDMQVWVDETNDLIRAHQKASA